MLFLSGCIACKTVALQQVKNKNYSLSKKQQKAGHGYPAYIIKYVNQAVFFKALKEAFRKAVFNPKCANLRIIENPDL